MGRSYSYSTSEAIDKRQVVSDLGIGNSIDGSSNTIGNAPLSGLQAQNLSIGITDGGIAGRAFDFASNTLSAALGQVIQTQKDQTASANSLAETVRGAITSALGQSQAASSRLADSVQSSISAAIGQSNAAARAAVESQAKAGDKAAADAAATQKKLAVGAAVAVALLWWLSRRHK